MRPNVRARVSLVGAQLSASAGASLTRPVLTRELALATRPAAGVTLPGAHPLIRSTASNTQVHRASIADSRSACDGKVGAMRMFVSSGSSP
ncbi:hypothetical protein RCH11_001346 [Glaciihabitans sp. GrIS 2.15]|nr:hypothetical protein [Glaciihabitans sp. GrIS 2.15]